MTRLITFTPLHPTFAAECKGVDFSQVPLPEEDIETIKAGIAQYGVLVFRQTGLDDDRHVEFSRQLGELDDMQPWVDAGREHRLKSTQLFDVSNLDMNGSVLKPDAGRAILSKGNSLFHCDSSFNGRRAGLSLLLSHELPPKSYGRVGNTEFADSRTAFEDLPGETKDRIRGYIANHSLLYSRRKANPDAPVVWEERFDPAKGRLSKHALVQIHEPSGRETMYVGAHAYTIDGLSVEAGQKEIDALLAHSAQLQYIYSFDWQNVGDMVMWDNTSVQHRAVIGPTKSDYRRDLRRTTVHDDSSYRYGLNGDGSDWRVGLP